jgi:hypothetical protein
MMKAILRAIKARAAAKAAIERERIEAAAQRLLAQREAAASKAELDAQIARAEAALATLKTGTTA